MAIQFPAPLKRLKFFEMVKNWQQNLLFMAFYNLTVIAIIFKMSEAFYILFNKHSTEVTAVFYMFTVAKKIQDDNNIQLITIICGDCETHFQEYSMDNFTV
jgi:uncharacterized CHY-type Zn-finger protein